MANPTNQDLLRVYRAVMAAKAAGQGGVNVDGYWFDMSAQGYCQRNARETYSAATGQPMPGQAGNAYQTYVNLCSLADGVKIKGITNRALLQDGDFIFLDETDLRTYVRVGHVGIKVPNGIFQDTSRDGLGITDEDFTPDQWTRFLGAFRLLPLRDDSTLDLLWGLAVNYATGAVLGSIAIRGMHDATERVYYDPTTAAQYPAETPPAGLLAENDVWGLLVSLADGSVTAAILPSGLDRTDRRVYVTPKA